VGAIFLRELESYFKSITGYLFGALLLTFTGIYTVIICLDNGNPSFGNVLASMLFVFVFAIPILTMRSFADERRLLTDRLLYSLPLGMTRIVLGKYFAMIAVVLIPMLIICCIPILLSRLGTVNFYAAYSSIVGFSMLAAALVSIGMFISSLTDNTVIAASLCFLAMLFNFFLGSLAAYVPSDPRSSLIALSISLLSTSLILLVLIKNLFISVIFFTVAETILCVLYILLSERFSGFFLFVVKQVSLFERFSLFWHDIFDLSAIFYYFSVCILFLFTTVQHLEKRRWN
jgi:ABC-2 type transport system permease protein